MDMSPELLDRLAQRFAALADARRLQLIMALKQGPSRVGDLAETLGLAQSSVSKHLTVLRQAGLIEVERVGNEGHYAIRDASLFPLCELVCNAVRDQVTAEAKALGLSTRSRR
jgi:DNA-binding transcriptional ArsR family regulator